ncbi:MAG: DUF192 domain-containing protein [Rhodothermales bacterium]
MRRDYDTTFAGLTARRTGAVLALAMLLLGGCRSRDDDLPTIRTDIPFRSDGTLTFIGPAGDTLDAIQIEIAETDEARTRGLMGRRSLPPKSGMFFIMEETDTSGFWMRNTPLPLDIMFVAPDSQIINIVERTTPYSEEIIRPAAPKKYVVEVRAGYAQRTDLPGGTRITWTRSTTTTGS